MDFENGWSTPTPDQLATPAPEASAIERRLVASIVARRARDPELHIAMRGAEEALFGVGQTLTLGRYVLVERIGAGAMGVVYAGFDPKLDRQVAIKLLRTADSSNNEGTHRLLHEARVLAKLAHPNVVSIFDVGTVDFAGSVSADPVVFLAMELVDGVTLARWCRAKAEWRATLAVFRQAGAGLAAIHDAGIVHRDFKPENVMVGSDGRVRVMDLGLARSDSSRAESELRTASSRAAVTAPAGTPAYMAPEQHDGQPATARSDQFSFCVALWETLYGQRPFRGETLLGLAEAMSTGRLLEPADSRGVPRSVRRALTRGLSARPEDRFASVPELLSALEFGSRRRVAVVAGACVVASAFVIAAAVDREMRARACEDAGASIRETWHEGSHERMTQAFLDTGAVTAPATIDLLRPRLDAFASDWAQAAAEVCLAHEGSTWDAEVYGLASECLGERLQAFSVLTDAFADPDATVVLHAIEAASALPRIDVCTDPTWLRRALPLPKDPGTHERVADVMRGLARVDLTALMGDAVIAAERAKSLVEEADDLGWGPMRAAARLRLGRATAALNDLPRARSLYDDALALAVDAQDDALVAEVLAELAHIAGVTLSRAEEGLAFLQVARNVSESSMLPEQFELRLLAIEANIELNRGDYVAAHELFLEQLKLAEALWPRDHPETAAAANGLGTALFRQHDLGGAERSYLRALAIQEAAFGPNHPRVAKTLQNLAATYANQGNYAEARAASQRAMTISERTYGENHVSVAANLRSLGQVAFELREFPKARELHAQAFETYRRVLGPQHPDVGRMLMQLAMVSQELGEEELARDQYGEAMNIMENALGPEHPELAVALDRLGRMAYLRGELDRAVDLYTRALEIRVRALPPTHPDISATKDAMGLVYAARGDYDEARRLVDEAVVGYRASVGETHYNYAVALDSRGLVELWAGSPETARAYVEQSVAILEKEFGADHAVLGSVYDTLGRALFELGEFDAALAYHRRALEADERSAAPMDPLVSSYLLGMADAELALGNAGRAREHAERALALIDDEGGTNEFLSEAQLVLASTLRMSPSADDRARARTLWRTACGQPYTRLAMRLDRCASR